MMLQKGEKIPKRKEKMRRKKRERENRKEKGKEFVEKKKRNKEKQKKERKEKEFAEKERRKKKRKGKEKGKGKREDFSTLRRSKLDGPSTKVGTRSAIYVWTLKSWSFDKLHKVEDFPTRFALSLKAIKWYGLFMVGHEI